MGFNKCVKVRDDGARELQGDGSDDNRKSKQHREELKTRWK